MQSDASAKPRQLAGSTINFEDSKFQIWGDISVRCMIVRQVCRIGEDPITSQTRYDRLLSRSCRRSQSNYTRTQIAMPLANGSLLSFVCCKPPKNPVTSAPQSIANLPLPNVTSRAAAKGVISRRSALLNYPQTRIKHRLQLRGCNGQVIPARCWRIRLIFVHAPWGAEWADIALNFGVTSFPFGDDISPPHANEIADRHPLPKYDINSVMPRPSSRPRETCCARAPDAT